MFNFDEKLESFDDLESILESELNLESEADYNLTSDDLDLMDIE